MIIRLLAVGLCIISGITSAPQKDTKDGSNFKFIILHNNDMHARFEQTGVLSNKCSQADAEANKCYGGFARVAHEVREYRRRAESGEIAKVLYLNAGDTYTGTPWFSLYKDEIASDFLKILKPDAISLGNHEFDEGSENLAKFLNEIDFPVLAANLDLEKEPQLKTDSLKPSIVFTIDERKIGIIGYLTPETKDVAIENNVEFIDEVVALNEEAAKLKAEGVNIIIALGHSGYERDKEIAEQCPDIDLVIGGHSHTFLFTGQPPNIDKPMGDFPTWVTQPSGKRVPVVQAYAFTKYLGYLHLEFDNDGNLIQIDGTPILLDASIPRDPDVLALLEKYRPGVLELENDIVGVTKVLLDGSCRRNECNLGNFLADAMVDWYAIKYESNEYWTDASIAFLQSGGIRASIDHKSSNGDITREDAATVFPFESKMEVVEVNGKELLEALEHSVHRYTDGEPRGEFLQFSGVHVSYDMNKASGQRVMEAKVLCAKCAIPELQEIKQTEMYKIVMLDFLAQGGDGYEMFKGKSVQKFDDLDVDVFVEYIKKKSPIHPAVEWRITIKNLIDEEEDVVGSTKVFLDNNCSQSECNLGNFITDAMVDWRALNHDDSESWTDVAIAVIQGSRIKSSLDAKINDGKILRKDALTVFQPAFFNLNIVTLTGEELWKLLEHSISSYGNENNVEFLQMSGIQVNYDLNKPVGQRVTEAKVLCAKCSVPELQTLQLAETYKVIMQSILASGADGFDVVIGTKSSEDLGESDVNVFIEYIEKKSPIHPAVEWRITIKDLIDENEAIGSTKVFLDNSCTQGECNIGNFITDAMVDWRALNYDDNEYWTDAAIAVLQGNRIKRSYNPRENEGKITRKEALEVFQTPNNLSIIEFTGSELLQFLEHSISNYDDLNNPEFLQMSGIQVTFDLNKSVGQRVTNVKVLCAKCIVPEIHTLQTNERYKVIMQSVLASGDAGYQTIVGSKSHEDLNETDVNVFIEYLMKKSPVHPAIEWRITINQSTTDSTTTTTATGQPESTPGSAKSNFNCSILFILIATCLCYFNSKFDELFL